MRKKAHIWPMQMENSCYEKHWYTQTLNARAAESHLLHPNQSKGKEREKAQGGIRLSDVSTHGIFSENPGAASAC